MRRIKKLKKFDSYAVGRNHVRQEHSVEILTKNITCFIGSVTRSGGHFRGTLKKGKTEHFPVPADGAFDVGYTSTYMVYCSWIN